MASENTEENNDEQQEKQEIKQAFEPIIVDTKDVLNELRSVATTHKIPLKEVDFILLETHTFFRTNKEEEWEDLVEEKKEMFEADEFLIHDQLEISQQYKIEIFPLGKNSIEQYLPNITLGANKTLTSVVATVQKCFDATILNSLEDKIIQAINKKKVRANILVGIREKDMLKEVRKIASALKVNGILEQDSVFTVMEGIKPIPSVNDELRYHYLKKTHQKDEQGRVDYARRGFVLPVEKDEVIIEYVKPKEGRSGRDCRGNYIDAGEPNVQHTESINTTEAISAKEDDDYIKYVATRDGYVVFENNTYDIQEQMDIDEVSFKATGSIEAGLDSNVTINIKENDIYKDAIGKGMKVETTTLNVDGSIASNASITANQANIGGQTHKTSTINAKKANIGVHKGTVIADEVEIDRLEYGEVIADKAKIRNVLGGKIIAREVEIDEMMSNANITISELLDIKKVIGNNNKIAIDPSKIKGVHQKVEEVKEKIDNAKKEYKLFPKKLESKKTTIDNGRMAINAIKERIVELKSKKIRPPANLISKVKEYQQLIEDYNGLLGDLKYKKEEIRMLEEELDSYQSQVYRAKIINHSSWTEFNEIRFVLIYPPVEIIHNTRENEISREITLKKTTEGEHQILRSTEFSK